MRANHVGAAAVLLLAMAPPLAAAQTADTTLKAINVRIYNNFGVQSDDLKTAQSQAEAILQEAGIAVSWTTCWVRNEAPADAPASCQLAPAGNDLVLRLQDAGAGRTPSAQVSMGFSLVSDAPGAQPAFLSTVKVDIVWSVARGARVGASVLLGDAIAHEIGHLLLNTNSHSEAGLMRAVWSRAELNRTVASDWRFIETDAATMREAIRARAN